MYPGDIAMQKPNRSNDDNKSVRVILGVLGIILGICVKNKM